MCRDSAYYVSLATGLDDDDDTDTVPLPLHGGGGGSGFPQRVYVQQESVMRATVHDADTGAPVEHVRSVDVVFNDSDSGIGHIDLYTADGYRSYPIRHATVESSDLLPPESTGV